MVRVGLFPVWCQTASGWCCEGEIFLGYHTLNTKVKCPVCNRWSTVRRSVRSARNEEQNEAYRNCMSYM